MSDITRVRGEFKLENVDEWTMPDRSAAAVTDFVKHALADDALTVH